VDVANIHERLRFIQPWQRVNHFPGMPQIARKGRMAQALENMRKEVGLCVARTRSVVFSLR